MPVSLKYCDIAVNLISCKTYVEKKKKKNIYSPVTLVGVFTRNKYVNVTQIDSESDLMFKKPKALFVFLQP